MSQFSGSADQPLARFGTSLLLGSNPRESRTTKCQTAVGGTHVLPAKWSIE